MNEPNFGLDGGDRGTFVYTGALLFVFFVPGTALLIFGGGKALILPEPMIESIFPYTILWPEKLLLTTVTEKFSVFGQITIGDFAAVHVFDQQFFILSLLCSLLVVAILTLQARAGRLYPLPYDLGILRVLRIFTVLVLLREIQVCLLVGKAPLMGSHEPRVQLVRLTLTNAAPESLIFLSCCVASLAWVAMLLAYRANFRTPHASEGDR